MHPRRYPVQTPLSGHPRHHHEGPTTDPAMRGSMDLRAVREYTLGDEPRHIHWRATARTGQLMVCDYLDPAQPRFVVMLDTRLGELDHDGFEAAVELTASLVYASAAHGHRTGLRTTTGLNVTTAGGLAASRELLDQLCEVTQVAAPRPWPQSVVGQLAPGGCLVYLSGGAAAADLGLIALFQRRFGQVVVVDLGRPPATASPPGVARIQARDAASAAAAWNAVVSRSARAGTSRPVR